MTIQADGGAAILGGARGDPSGSPSTRAKLVMTAVNHARPVPKPLLTAVEERALAEAESMYSPQGVLRLMTTYDRPAVGAGNYVGHGQYCDFDHIVSRLLDIPGLATTYGSQVYGGGKGLDRFDSYVSSLGEGIERLLGSFALFAWQDRIEYGSHRSLTARGLQALHPEQLPIFSAVQHADPNFEFVRWDEDDVVGWIPGTRYFSGETVYVPAQLVLFIYYRRDDEPRIGLAPSGGLASHISDDRARLHAISELLERDAINLRWHNGIPLDRVAVDVPFRDPEVNAAWSRLSEQFNPPDLFFHNLDFHELPVMTLVSFDDWLDELAYNAGGGVGTTPDAACRSAIGEYAQSERSLRICQVTANWRFSDSFHSLFGIAADAPPSKFSRYIQAITFYGYRSNRERTRAYFSEGRTTSLSELYARADDLPADPIACLEHAMRTRGSDPIMFDFSLRSMRHLRLWKAFMPELTAPYPPSSPAVGHPRYSKIAEANGFTPPNPLIHTPVPYP